MKIGPVVLEEKILIEVALPVDVMIRHISSNISGCPEPIFAIFSPYESALRDDDVSLLIFEFVKGPCHGNQFSGKNGAKLPTP